jgi:Xaa-Pro dipeptidase
LQNLVEKSGMDIAIITDPKNVYYFTGYSNASVLPLPSYLIAFKKDDPVLLTGVTEVANAERTFGGRIETFTNYSLKERMIAYPDLAADRIRKLIKNQKLRKAGLEYWTTPVTAQQAILKKGANTKLFDLSGKILTWRKIKDSDEVAAIRESCELDDYAYSVIKEEIRNDLTEVEVYSLAYQKLIKKANSPSFQFFYGDFTSGERALQSGGPPTDRAMRNGETLVLDLWVTTRGYWADTCRTFVIGRQASAEQNRTLDLLKHALNAGAEKLKPGNTAAEVYNAIFNVIAAAGYGDKFPHHGGHCVGLDAWEPPFIIPGSKEKLKEGMVCALEPGVYIPEIGGMRIEDDYLIKSTGSESLCKFPFDL